MTPSAQPLPPALARLASALELSSGFLLYFLTGPRDHADSVYLRLRALDPDVELVRHRIRSATDLELADLLSNSADERPRVVFLSGLETLDTATRRELSERLNLLRDSWAPHPARIVFWLPSWGLAEFRRIAPDLFDWRSGLITLNDADLPIRSELEYLVWACERYRSARTSYGSIEWNDQNVPPFHLALVGLGPAERSLMLANSVLAFASVALVPGNFGIRPGDLLLTKPRKVGDPNASPPVPVFVRSQDAAGKLDEHTPWLSLAHAAGVPGPATAAAVFADLAAAGRLLVLLEGFDRLGLDDGDAPRRWLERMHAHDPPLRMIAALAGPATGVLATWPRTSFAEFERLPNDDELPRRYRDLIRLIKALFPGREDLTTLASYFLGVEADELELEGHHEQVATRLIVACARRGLLDASFFAELTRMRPAHTAEIEAVARSLTGP